jgi:hypothetical protein
LLYHIKKQNHNQLYPYHQFHHIKLNTPENIKKSQSSNHKGWKILLFLGQFQNARTKFGTAKFWVWAGSNGGHTMLGKLPVVSWNVTVETLSSSWIVHLTLPWKGSHAAMAKPTRPLSICWNFDQSKSKNEAKNRCNALQSWIVITLHRNYPNNRNVQFFLLPTLGVFLLNERDNCTLFWRNKQTRAIVQGFLFIFSVVQNCHFDAMGSKTYDYLGVVYNRCGLQLHGCLYYELCTSSTGSTVGLLCSTCTKKIEKYPFQIIK